MNETVNEESKSAAMKTLAIIGLIAVIIVGLWLTIQVVRYLPTGFASLASLLDRTRDGEVVFSVDAEKGVANSGEFFRIHWTAVPEDGAYVFSYTCVDGVSLSVRESGAVTPVRCDTDFWIAQRDERGGETLEVSFSAEKARYNDVRFSVGFVPQGAGTPTHTKSSVVTIVNTNLPEPGAETPAQPTTPSTPSTPTQPTTPTTGGPGTTPTYYTTVPVVTTYYPVSDPRGFVDLEVTFLGVSQSANGTFSPNNELEEGEDGYIRFAVKNIGTKTSDRWTFEAALPNASETTYRSPKQRELLPSERAVITLSFDRAADEGRVRIDISVDEPNDRQSSNDSVSPSIRIDR